MEGGLGWKRGKEEGGEGGRGWREAGVGGRAGLEGREEGEGGNRGKLFCLVTRSCEAGDKCLVTFSLVSCERSEHSQAHQLAKPGGSFGAEPPYLAEQAKRSPAYSTASTLYNG